MNVDIKSSQTVKTLSKYLLQGSALVTIVSIAITYAFHSDFNTDSLGIFDFFFIYLLVGASGWLMIPFALLLTPYRVSQSYGASISMLIALGIIGSVLFNLFTGNGISWIFDDYMYLQLAVVAFVTGVFSAIFLIVNSGYRSKITIKLITTISVGVLLFVQCWNTFPGTSAGDALQGWDWQAVLSIFIPLVIGSVVLFLSDVKVSSFLLLTTSLLFSIYRFHDFVALFRDSKPDKNYEEYADYYGELAESLGKPNVLVSVQFIVALACLIYALYVINFDGKKLVKEY